MISTSFSSYSSSKRVPGGATTSVSDTLYIDAYAPLGYSTTISVRLPGQSLNANPSPCDMSSDPDAKPSFSFSGPSNSSSASVSPRQVWKPGPL